MIQSARSTNRNIRFVSICPLSHIRPTDSTLPPATYSPPPRGSSHVYDLALDILEHERSSATSFARKLEKEADSLSETLSTSSR